MILKLNHLLLEEINIQSISNIRLGMLGFHVNSPVVSEVFDVCYNGLKIVEKKTRSKLLHTDCFLMRDGQVILKHAI